MSTLLHAFRHRTPTWIARTPIAHRGLHDDSRPENTRAAFENAADAGYAIELDVHLSRDGQPVVFHDATLDRLTEHRGPIAARDWPELREFKIAGTSETIPKLQDVLERVGDRVPVVVEIKNEGTPGRIERAVARALRTYAGRVCVQSFNPKSLMWFKRHAPEFPRGLLSTDFAERSLPMHQKVALENLLLAPMVRPAYVGYDLRCLPHWAPSVARRLGVPLLAWTVRNDHDLRRGHALADNVIFERVRPQANAATVLGTCGATA